MKTIVYIACSLDGNIARADGALDWLENIPNPNRDDYGFSEFMGAIDAVVMGRKTFETVITFGSWPYTKPVFVLSKTLDHITGSYASKAELIQGNPYEILSHLEKRGIHTVYIDGGMTIQGFLKEDLIDEMIITTVSIILGNGRKLFVDVTGDLEFRLTKTERISEMLVKNHYVRNRRQASRDHI